MKKKLFSAMFTLLCMNIFAQTDWVKNSGNPVIDSTKDLSATSAYAPTVFIDGTTYHLWYTRKTGTARENIGYMTSTNGLSWTLVDSLAILPSTDGTRFDSKKLGQASVIKDGDTLKMWYWGATSSTNAGIGYAWSLNGHNWTKVDGPGVGKSVLDLTTDGSGALAIATPCVIKDGSTYRMWYARAFLNGTQVGYRIGHATSADGIAWTVVTGPGTSGAVIDLGAPGKFDESFAFFPCVIKSNNLFQMWYAGYDSISTFREGYATSSDGINWTKINGTSAKGSCLDSGAASSVSLVGSTYKMWYSSATPAGFGYATSGTTSTGIGSIINTFSSFQIYPNPSNGNFNIELKNNEATGSVKIYNLNGQLVYSSTLTNNLFVESNLHNGLYMLEYINEKGLHYMRKIIVE